MFKIYNWIKWGKHLEQYVEMFWAASQVPEISTKSSINNKNVYHVT